MTQSNDPAIIEMNEAIARFLGYEERHDEFRRPNNTLVFMIEKYWTPIHHLKYHTSWDWLKPVIDEIFKYALAHPEEVRPVIEMSIVVSIQAAHEKVYKFCKWYNKNKTQ